MRTLFLKVLNLIWSIQGTLKIMSQQEGAEKGYGTHYVFGYKLAIFY